MLLLSSHKQNGPGVLQDRTGVCWDTFLRLYVVTPTIHSTVPSPAVLCHICPYPWISYFYFHCSSVYVVSCSVPFMSLWFVAYSCTIFASLWRSSPMSRASQFPAQLLWLSCLTHRKYSANILGLISTKQNNSPRIHVKSS